MTENKEIISIFAPQVSALSHPLPIMSAIAVAPKEKLDAAENQRVSF